MMMLASNLIAWTRNFLKMGGMEDAFFFLLLLPFRKINKFAHFYTLRLYLQDHQVINHYQAAL
uniref:Uncharacterized protein n=1 Tax=Citrobacter freundii TaxID=546 RepID=A0A7T8YYH7_CITFR|nr:hypothetical protein JJQ52_00530 [Citrobacter freundii]